ncbi:MAG: YqaE/Pmp3 family membrane protein [Gemmatimonadota bacterium]|nr:YqaE/Pmp3 family membrane protein [Gemmatimonadota bacterium]MDE3006720.1 YqaE/Pmp3 family membrane protein [Gemmatimonadota bacterium]MDE3012733.1 YqaE/Pmp3 family membrane protein [Gemmatimonadota bacterium]
MDNKLVLIIAAVFAPPLAVFLKYGFGKNLVINIILTFFFFVPGMIHSLWLVTK